MSDLDDEQPEMAEMLNKMTRYNKNVKALMELMNKAAEKLDMLLKNKTSNDTGDDADASVEDLARLRDKERMDKIFEAKKIGRLVGTFESKQQQYLKMLTEGKINMPKAQTLEFYRIEKDSEVFKVMGE